MSRPPAAAASPLPHRLLPSVGSGPYAYYMKIALEKSCLKSRKVGFRFWDLSAYLLFPFMFPVLFSVTARNSGQEDARWSSLDAMMVEDNS